jgi:hypothetical protein
VRYFDSVRSLSTGRGTAVSQQRTRLGEKSAGFACDRVTRHVEKLRDWLLFAVVEQPNNYCYLSDGSRIGRSIKVYAAVCSFTILWSILTIVDGTE